MSNKRIVPILFFMVLICCLFVFIFYKADKLKEKLKKNKVVVKGDYIGVSPFPRGDGLWIYYAFTTLKNIKVNGKARVFIEKKYKQKVDSSLSHRRLLVVYDSTEVDNNNILIMKKDYLTFDHDIPNDLKDIVGYFDSIKR